MRRAAAAILIAVLGLLGVWVIFGWVLPLMRGGL